MSLQPPRLLQQIKIVLNYLKDLFSTMTDKQSEAVTRKPTKYLTQFS